MADLSRRPVRTLLLFSADDPGIKELERHFGPLGADLPRAAPGTKVTIIPGLDHDLTTRTMQQTVLRPMLDFLLHQPATPPRDSTPQELVS
jgi:hypothetical protein